MRSLRGIERLLLPGHRQRFERAERDARLIVQLLGRRRQVWEALGQSLEDLLAFDPRQGRTQAVVNSVSEGHMRVWLPRNVEPVGFGEHVGIAVGRRDKPANTV